MRRFLSRLREGFPLLAVGAATLWACVSIALNRVAEAPPGVTVLRIAHWQLEAGVRDAINAMAADYQRLHPHVRVVQDAIPDQVFAQWTNTQLVGGNPPDLIEAGGQMAPSLWLNLQRRYLMPLTEHYARPNPYNAGTALADVPLTKALRGGVAVVPELQEVMDVSLSRVAVRIVYNRDLLRQLTGLERPPEDLDAFLDVCRQIAAKNCVPIVGSDYHFSLWTQLFDALTYPAVRRADFNGDGFVGNDELFVAFQRQRLDFAFPPYRARFDLIANLARYFQPGFTGLTREEGVLLFAQQQAVFMPIGLWEARGVLDLAGDKFKVEVMRFPEPAVGNSALEGPIFEAPRVVLGFAVPRGSKHPELAVDFLLFMASQAQNEKLNRITGWIPNAAGASPDAALAAFEPTMEGVYPAMDFNLSADTTIRWRQLMELFAVDQISYDDFATEFSAYYRDRGQIGFADAQHNWQRGLLQNEQLRATLRARAMRAAPAEADALWAKYCRLFTGNQVAEVLDHRYLVDLLQGSAPLPPAADDYSPAVREKVRARLLPPP